MHRKYLEEYAPAFNCHHGGGKEQWRTHIFHFITYFFIVWLFLGENVFFSKSIKIFKKKSKSWHY